MRKCLVLWVLIMSINCNPHYSSHFIKQTGLENDTQSTSLSLRFARGDQNIPVHFYDSVVTPKTIRVVIHFMNSSDSSNNYLGADGIKYAKSLIDAVNNDLANNQKMNLPVGNETEALKTNYSLQLLNEPEGIQFHFDDDLYYFVKQGKHRNNYSREVTNKYAINADSILNLFILSHHPDSIVSSTYMADGSGVTLGTSIKVAGLYENGGPAANYRGLVNHEIGHVLGLRHAWGFDPCEDTPTHANCWAQTGVPPCDGPVSNNLMDYNPFQNAITPCQLAIIHKNLGKYHSRIRKLVMPTWCELDESKNINIIDSVVWDFEIDLEGNLIILENGILELKTRVSIPENGKITIYPGGKLILQDGVVVHNSCNRLWQGIEVLETNKSKGEIVFLGNAKIENTYLLDN